MGGRDITVKADSGQGTTMKNSRHWREFAVALAKRLGHSGVALMAFPAQIAPPERFAPTGSLGNLVWKM
jgi:hypothetical protein